jgi:HAD superfamily hydrolase (TIGR01509 family)
VAFPRRIQAVVFDMDGLLIDSEVVVRAAVMRTAEAFDRDFPEALYAQAIGRSEADYVALVTAHFGDDFPMDRFMAEEALEVERAFQAGVCLKAGVVELVEEIEARGLPFALATSSSRKSAERHLREHGLWDRFRAVVGREDVDRHKPHPDPYLEAARRLGVAPGGCLALEDSHNGVRAAHAAGMMTVMVPDLLAPTDEMHGLCVHVLESLHEVRDRIRTAAG